MRSITGAFKVTVMNFNSPPKLGHAGSAAAHVPAQLISFRIDPDRKQPFTARQPCQ